MQQKNLAPQDRVCGPSRCIMDGNATGRADTDAGVTRVPRGRLGVSAGTVKGHRAALDKMSKGA